MSAVVTAEDINFVVINSSAHALTGRAHASFVRPRICVNTIRNEFLGWAGTISFINSLFEGWVLICFSCS
jgi:hypothetical protein